MNTFNRFYRKRRKSSPHESFDLAYSGLRERSHESGSDFPQLLDHENQFDGLPDAKDPEADSDIDTSGQRTDSVFSYLSAIGPIRILSREEELGLAMGIAEGRSPRRRCLPCSRFAGFSTWERRSLPGSWMRAR